MTNARIDNSAIGYGNVVLWQYDKAFNLIRVLAFMRELYNAAVSGFWGFWCSSVLAIDRCDDFGADMWAIFIGVVRPKVTIDGQTRQISLDLFKRYLKASFYLMNSDCSLPALNEFYRILFPYYSSQKVYIEDNFNMSIEFKVNDNAMTTEELAFFNQNKEDLTPHPLGILTNQPVEEFVFGFAGQEDEYDDYEIRVAYNKDDIVKYDDGSSGYIKWKCIQSVSVAYNTSWNAVKSRFEPTIEGDPIVAGICNEVNVVSYKSGMAYCVGSIVIKSGVKYRCTTEVPVTENTSWDSIASRFRQLLFKFGEGYEVGEIVEYFDGTMWICVNKMYQSQNVTEEEFLLHFSEMYSKTTFICSTTSKMSSMGVYEDRQAAHYLISEIPELKSVSKTIVSYNEIAKAMNMTDENTIADVMRLR